MSGMNVRTNTTALNIHTQISKVNQNEKIASARLSSGYRINSAADDAAGLGISEKMRAQIKGLDRASLNAQDGISLIQTAEGAISTINEKLIRLRELLVQAANDTNVHKDGHEAQSDRARIQDEIDQLMIEINSVAHRTEFNTRTLLNGSLSHEGIIGGGNWHTVDEVVINAPARVSTLDQFLRMTSNEPFMGSFDDLLRTIGANLEGMSAAEWISVHAGANFSGLEQALDSAMAGRWAQTEHISGLRFGSANELLSAFVQGFDDPFSSWADFVENSASNMGAGTFARKVSQTGGETIYQALIRAGFQGLDANATFNDVRNVFYRLGGGWAHGGLRDEIVAALSYVGVGRAQNWLEIKVGETVEPPSSSASTQPVIIVPGSNPLVSSATLPSAPFVSNATTMPTQTTPPFQRVSNLLTLTEFPREGSFVIQVRDPDVGTVNAILDFGAVNPTGGYTLNQFIEFFENAFAGIADFEVDDVTGHINVQTTGAGGPDSGVTIGLTNITQILSSHTNVPPTANLNPTIFANSAFFDAQRSGSVSTTPGANTGIRVTPEELATINATGTFAGMDAWQLLHPDFNGALAGSDPFWLSSTALRLTPQNTWTSVGSTLSLNRENLGDPQTLEEFRAEASARFAAHPYLNRTLFNPRFRVDAGGYLHIDFQGGTSVNSPATSSSVTQPTFTLAVASAASVLSNHPARASESGILTIDLRVRDGSGTRPISVDIDFSAPHFASWETNHLLSGLPPFSSKTEYMEWYINQRLNQPSNWPDPLPDFIRPGYDRGTRPLPGDPVPVHPAPVTYFPVARASIVGGNLLITAAETNTTLTVRESGSTHPMFFAHVGTLPPRTPSVELYISGGATRINEDSGSLNLSSNMPGTFIWHKVPANTPSGTIDADWLLDYGTRSSTSDTEYSIDFSDISINDYRIYAIQIGTANIPSNVMTLRIPPAPVHDLWQIFTDRYLTGDTEIIQREIWVANPDERERGAPLWFQIGANSGQGLTVGINGMTTRHLAEPHDLAELIDVENPSGIPISDQLGYIDRALEHATRERSFLGAVQNRLEFTKQNLDIASENLSTANSRIRDADMALEMMRLTQANVIQQAAISMLAQANQAPQSVLQLLE